MLSIIIPTLNEERCLPELLDNLKRLKLKKYEIIVSDGSSKDKTRIIAKKHGCKVVISKKQSPAHQRNKGAEIAKGTYLFFVDADTLLPNDFFPAVLNEFKKRELAVAGFQSILNSPKLKYQITTYYSLFNTWLFSLFRPISIGGTIMSMKVWHDKIGGFDETITVGEDHEYSLSIKKAGGKYGLIKSKKFLLSVRRFEKEGLLCVLGKWWKLIFYYIFKGPARKKVVEYEFDNN